MSLEELYSDFIMYHYKNPNHRGEIENCDLTEKGANLSCGDEITLYVKMNGDVISNIKFDGQGCAISQSSASVMIDILEGKTIEDAVRIIENFGRMLRGEKFDDMLLEDATFFESLKSYPLRIKCANLPWQTMLVALGK